MNEMKLQKALGLLEAIVSELPDGGVDIEETYVTLYHQTLTTIQSELRCDLAEFFVPSSALTRQRNGGEYYGYRNPRLPRPEITYSQERYCERARFMMAIKGAVNFINALLAHDPAKRIVGFGKSE